MTYYNEMYEGSQVREPYARLSQWVETMPADFRQMKQAADQNGIPYSVTASPRLTFTDADTMILSGAGVPSARVSTSGRSSSRPASQVETMLSIPRRTKGMQELDG